MARPRIRYLRHRRLARQRYGLPSGFFTTQAARLAASATAVTSSVVTPASDSMTITGHGLSTGEGPVQVSSSGTLPSPLASTDLYYVGADDANTIRLYPTARDAVDDTNAIDLTDAGSGNVDLARSVTAQGVFDRMAKGGFSSETLVAASDIDNI